MPRRSALSLDPDQDGGPVLSYRGLLHNTRLKLAIVRRGITQQAIAARMRISVFRLSRIVRGHQAPTADEQDQLSELLGVPRATLFKGIRP